MYNKVILFAILLISTNLIISCGGTPSYTPPENNELVANSINKKDFLNSNEKELLLNLDTLRRQWKTFFDSSNIANVESIQKELTEQVSTHYNELIMIMKKNDDECSSAIAALLGFSNDKETYKVLIDMLKSKSPAIRANACISIGLLGNLDTPSMPLANLLMFDPDPDVRNAAAFAIFKTISHDNNKGVFKTVLKALDDPDDGVRNEAVRTLMKIGNKEASHDLLDKTLGDPNPIVRENTRQAILLLKDYSIIEKLINNLSNNNSEIRISSLYILKRLTQVDMGDEAFTWKKWWENNKKFFVETPKETEPKTPPKKEKEEKKFY